MFEFDFASQRALRERWCDYFHWTKVRYVVNYFCECFFGMFVRVEEEVLVVTGLLVTNSIDAKR